MNDEILSRLTHLTALVLELREDQKLLQTEIKKITTKHREINGLRASLATVTAERKLLRKVQSTLSRLMTPDPEPKEFETMQRRKSQRDY